MSGFEEWYATVTGGGGSFGNERVDMKAGWDAGRADRQEQDAQIAYNDGTTCDEFTNTSCSAGYVIAKAIREAE